MVTYNLVVKRPKKAGMSTPRIVFPSDPLEWVEPTGMPNGVSFSRNGDKTTTTVTVPGASTGTKMFRFHIRVKNLDDGEIFTSDPTIVTMPPGT